MGYHGLCIDVVNGYKLLQLGVTMAFGWYGLFVGAGKIGPDGKKKLWFTRIFVILGIEKLVFRTFQSCLRDV